MSSLKKGEKLFIYNVTFLLFVRITCALLSLRVKFGIQMFVIIIVSYNFADFSNAYKFFILLNALNKTQCLLRFYVTRTVLSYFRTALLYNLYVFIDRVTL